MTMKMTIDDSKKRFYCKQNGKLWEVWQRFLTVPDKAIKTYKTERGARNHAFHRNLG